MTYAKPQKCIAFTGDSAQLNWAWPEDFRFWANSSYVRDSGTKWVRFWVSLFQLQYTEGMALPTTRFGEQVTDFRTSCDNLNFAHPNDDWNPAFPGSREPNVPYLQKLDRQIRAANDAGLNVILTIFPQYPYWVTGTTAAEPATGKLPSYHHPAQLNVNTPWGWFVGHLCARYRYWSSAAAGVPANAYGPHTPAYTSLGESSNPPYNVAFGNPSGAYISALEITNEPNGFSWPQYAEGGNQNNQYGLTQAYVASAMFYIAYQYAAAYGAPALLGPGTLDVDATTSGAPRKVNYYPFNKQVVEYMAGAYGYPPTNQTVYMGFSQHNYGDIARARGYDESYTRQTKLLIAPYNWHTTVWLTEGGFATAHPNIAGTQEDVDQAVLVVAGFSEMDDYNRASASGEVPIFSQYSVNNLPATNPGTWGMRDQFKFQNGVPYTWGANHFLLNDWKTL